MPDKSTTVAQSVRAALIAKHIDPDAQGAIDRTCRDNYNFTRDDFISLLEDIKDRLVNSPTSYNFTYDDEFVDTNWSAALGQLTGAVDANTSDPNG